jgi:hypothetical protein
MILIQSLLITFAHGQMPNATYDCRVNIDPQGNGSVDVIYAIFASDQNLQISTREIAFPVFNSSLIQTETMYVTDIYGETLTWQWDDSEFLMVRIGPLNILPGGKYEVSINYYQENLSKIIGDYHYFVYEWDFSRIMYSPYTITQYTLQIQRPDDTLFDTFLVDYIGVSPTNLNDYVTESGATIRLAYGLSVSKVTVNIYYRHEQGLPVFTITAGMLLIMSLATLFLLMKRKRTMKL